ncbi:hypothetical protein U8607_01645 [Methylobacterium durans]|uniref:hypothetical protein n=1 Tax=Methylobacterium durans TaxID=2202825 RepID=UPI002AFFA9DD|nr:hypothetical protein [Methylobacterium durans]MEA1830775.1 hypothetical protein [Methylobacterium durans]
MLKTLALTSALITAGIGGALAQTTFMAWGHNFDLSPFRATEMQVATATERGTGKSFNVVKLKNGHMMAVVGIDRMSGAPAATADADMIN